MSFLDAHGPELHKDDSWKYPVLVATTANITLSGEQTIDGVLTSASRVLVKDHATGSSKGIYVSAAGAWTRAYDMQHGLETRGCIVYVVSGTANGGKLFRNTNTALPTIGSTALTFVEYTPAPSGAAGGDLSGTYPNPTVSKVEGVDVTDAGTTGDVLTKTGAATATWQTPASTDPADDPSVWMPLTTVVAGDPVLVWDADDSLIPTLVPI